jgi:hypothetical protein
MFSPVQVGFEDPVAQPGSSFFGDTIMDDDDKTSDAIGNEPSPILFFGAALLPIFAVLGWFALG